MMSQFDDEMVGFANRPENVSLIPRSYIVGPSYFCS